MSKYMDIHESHSSARSGLYLNQLTTLGEISNDKTFSMLSHSKADSQHTYGDEVPNLPSSDQKNSKMDEIVNSIES